MLGLFLHDIYSMKKSVKTYGMFLAFFAVLAVVSGNVSFFSSFIAIYSMLFGISVISYHEMNGWDTYANTLPVTRAQIVQSLYLVGGVSILVGFLIGCGLNLSLVLAGEMTLLECVVGMIAIYSVGFLMVAVDYPLLMRFGSERGRLIMMGSYIVLFVGIMGVVKLLGEDFLNRVFTEWFGSTQNIVIVVAVAFLVSLLALFLSYRVSLRIYRKKEF